MSDQQIMTMAEVRGAVEDGVGDRPDVGVFLTPYGSGGDGPREALLELTRMSHAACDRCGQSLPVLQPAPVTWIDERTGQVQGAHSHQHGCGEWNTPQAVSAELVPVEPDEAEEHPSVAREVAQERLAAQAEALLAELDRQVAEDVAERETRVRASLREQLRHALADLATSTAAERDPERRAWADEAARQQAKAYAALLNERLDERIEQARRYGGVGGDRARPAGPLAVVGDVEQERDALVAALEGQRTSWQAHYQPPERKSGEELLEQVCTGSQFEPGVYVGEDGRLAAWAPTVLPELEQEPEGIWVTQDDLAGDVHAQPR